MTPRLSILEFGNIDPPLCYAHDVISHLFEYVSLLDELGYYRFWLSEHYSPEFAWYTPEILLPLLAGHSDRIKIGQAGVLLNYHSSLKVAHNFSTLSALFPERIDLGLVPAYTSDEASKALTDKENQPLTTDFKRKVIEIFKLLNGDPINNNNPDSLHLPLQGTYKPHVWFLGVSESSVPYAIDYKANFCLSLFHPGANHPRQLATVQKYKDGFFKKHKEKPTCVISLQCLCSNDVEKIEHWRLKFKTKPEQPNGIVIGEPSECVTRLLSIAEMYGVEEIVLNIPDSSLSVKKETVKLIGQEMTQKSEKLQTYF